MRKIQVLQKSNKILYLNNFRGAGLGGGERHLLALATGARDAGYNVVVGCVDGRGLHKELMAAGIARRPIRFSANIFSAVGESRRLIRREKPDILHTTGFWTNNIGRLAGRLEHVTVIISEIHCEPDSTVKFNRSLTARIGQILRNVLDRFTSRFADKIITVSEQIRDKLISRGLSAGKVITIYNAFSPEPIARAARGRPATVLPDGIIIGVVGRLEAVKGIDDLLEALRLLLDDGLAVNLVIVGDGPLKNHLEWRVVDMALTERVVFTGWLEYAEAVKVLSRLDVYALPSLSEGLNTTLLEALALERPTVATTVGGNPEVIIDNRTGLLAPPKDPAALAAAIKKLIDDPALAKRLAASGRQLVMEKFTIDKMLAATLKLYNEMGSDLHS